MCLQMFRKYWKVVVCVWQVLPVVVVFYMKYNQLIILYLRLLSCHCVYRSITLC